MKKILALLFLGLLCSPITTAQLPCQEIRNDTLMSLKVEKEDLPDAVHKDVDVIINCLELDSIEMIMLTKPLLSAYIKALSFENSFSTFAPLLDSIEKLRAEPYYQATKDLTFFVWRYEGEPIKMMYWVQLEPLLLAIGYDSTQVAKIRNQFQQDISTGISYREFLEEALSSDKKREPNIEKAKSPFDIFNEMQPLEMMLEKGRQEGKPLLLYFSGWASVNSRKMEEMHLEANLFIEIERMFTPFIGYTDDRSAISEEQKITWKIAGDEFRNLGQYYTQFQTELFKSNMQPFYAVISLEGKTLRTLGYTLDAEKFSDFLNPK